MKPQYLNNYDVLKFIAITTMVIDHIGMFFFPEISEYRAIGRIAFPIFLFLVGYSGKYEFSKNLLIWGLILSYLKFAFNFQSKEANILITIFLTRILFEELDRREYLKKFPLEIILGFSFLSVITIFLFEYGSLAFLFAYLGFQMKKNESPVKTKLFLIYCLIINFTLQYYAFSFKDAQFTKIFIIVSFFLYYLFNNFSLKEVELKSQIISNSIKFIARNSLNIYIYHFILFALVAKLIL